MQSALGSARCLSPAQLLGQFLARHQTLTWSTMQPSSHRSQGCQKLGRSVGGAHLSLQLLTWRYSSLHCKACKGIRSQGNCCLN